MKTCPFLIPHSSLTNAPVCISAWWSQRLPIPGQGRGWRWGPALGQDSMAQQDSLFSKPQRCWRLVLELLRFHKTAPNPFSAAKPFDRNWSETAWQIKGLKYEHVSRAPPLLAKAGSAVQRRRQMYWEGGCLCKAPCRAQYAACIYSFIFAPPAQGNGKSLIKPALFPLLELTGLEAGLQRQRFLSLKSGFAVWNQKSA